MMICYRIKYYCLKVMVLISPVSCILILEFLRFRNRNEKDAGVLSHGFGGKNRFYINMPIWARVWWER